jgi:hypothetical protein
MKRKENEELLDQSPMMCLSSQEDDISSIHTDLVGESGEHRASGAAGEPEHERVVGGAPLGVDEVVEEADAIALVHLDVAATMPQPNGPGITQDGLMQVAKKIEGTKGLVGTLSGGRRGGVPGSLGDG